MLQKTNYSQSVSKFAKPWWNEIYNKLWIFEAFADASVCEIDRKYRSQWIKFLVALITITEAILSELI